MCFWYRYIDTLHYIHDMTLRCVALHGTTLHYATLHYTTYIIHTCMMFTHTNALSHGESSHTPTCQPSTSMIPFVCSLVRNKLSACSYALALYAALKCHMHCHSQIIRPLDSSLNLSHHELHEMIQVVQTSKPCPNPTGRSLVKQIRDKTL
jgi:hypothetical protein